MNIAGMGTAVEIKERARNVPDNQISLHLDVPNFKNRKISYASFRQSLITAAPINYLSFALHPFAIQNSFNAINIY